MTTVTFGKHQCEIGGPQLGMLRESNDLRDDFAALRSRLDEDGYLLIRGLYDPADVLAARREILAQAHGYLEPGSDPMEAVINRAPPKDLPFISHGSPTTRGPAFLSLVEGPRVMRFFAGLFAEPATTFDFKWLRLTWKGQTTGAHFDNSYMGRGSPRVHTVWSPLGDISYDHGPLAIVPGSHRAPGYAHLRETLGLMDVDRDRVRGDFSDDALEFTNRFGGRWATSEFKAGDAIIFGMFTLHASLTNVSDRFRLSSDTRYQPASEPADERWVGEKPKGHYAWFAGEGVEMAKKKKEWGF